MSQGDAGREKMVNQLLSFGADVAGQSAELAKLVAENFFAAMSEWLKEGKK